jgi:hypothetical protein
MCMSDYKTPKNSQSPAFADSEAQVRLITLAGPSAKLQDDLRAVLNDIPEGQDTAWNAVKTYLPVAAGLGVEGTAIIKTAEAIIAEPRGDLMHAFSQNDMQEAERLLTTAGLIEPPECAIHEV